MTDYHDGRQPWPETAANGPPPRLPSPVEQLRLLQWRQEGSSTPEPYSQLEALVPRLGEYLLAMGVLHREELKAALHEQQRCTRAGRPMLLGQLLLEMGYVDRATLDQAVVLQIMQLHEALSSQNLELERKVAVQTQRLSQALARAKRLQWQKDEFINIISHELRTPLTLILGYLDLFRFGDLGAVSREQNRALSEMDSAGEHLNQLINNLLFFATFWRGEIEITPEPLPVHSLFETVLRQKVAVAEQRRIRLLVGLGAKPALVMADRAKIYWAVSEILENALKFTGPGGTVTIAGRRQDPHDFEIAVVDDGPGIPLEYQQEIFEPFRQLDGSLTRRVDGLGLGLTLVQNIMRAHGSQVRIASTEGGGTRVSISLPLSACSHHGQRSDK